MISINSSSLQGLLMLHACLHVCQYLWDGSIKSQPLCTSQVNTLMANMKSDLAVTSLELSCDPDEGEPSSKELRPVECKDGNVSSDTKKSMESNDSDLDEDILDV